METAGDIIRDALQEILVQDAEQPIEAVELQAGIRYLNRMMTEWDLQGLPLGYTVVSNPADVVTVADGILGPVVYNLALKLAPQFDIQPSPLLVVNAREGMATIRQFAVGIPETCLPETLPLGSGNEGHVIDNTRHFFPPEPDELLSETNGNILLESDT